MKTIQEVFEENLRRLRGKESQPDFAERAGIPFPTYRGAENGHIPQPDTQEAIAKAFNVSVSTLFLDQDVLRDRVLRAVLVTYFETLAPGDIDHLCLLADQWSKAPSGRQKNQEIENPGD